MKVFRKKALIAFSSVALGVPALTLAAARITKVEFMGKSSPNEIVITGDGPLEFEKTENPDDKQVIIEIPDARFANKNVGRKLDTSSFDGKVSLISPYSVGGKVRVIVQLRSGAEAIAQAEGNKIRVAIDGAPAGDLPKLADASTSSGAGDAPADEPSGDIPEAPLSAAEDPRPTVGDGEGVVASDPVKRMDQFFEAEKTKKYVGSHLTLQVRDMDIIDVFRLIGETSGFNIILGGDVNGRVTLSLIDVPWDLALDTVLTTQRLGAERTGNILRIAPLTTLTAEKQALVAAKEAAQASAPRVTRIFPISYATPSALVPVLSKFGGGNAGGGGGSARDTIIVDERTNSIVIQDTQDNIERMAKIIQLLDRATPQVLIEGKVVEASEDFSKEFQGAFGTQRTTTTSFGNMSAQDGLITNPFQADADSGGSSSGVPGNDFGLGYNFRALAGIRLQAFLSLAEREQKSKVISSPRTVVLNKQSATIVQGTPVLVPTVITNPVNGTTSIGRTTQSANLSLRVTPTVTNDGNVLMDLNISNDTPKVLDQTNTGIANKNITTKVVAESGSTLVIGGVYTFTETHTEGGLPFFRKLPLIGPLFGSETNSNSRNELFIFITPRILNEKEAVPAAGGTGV